MKPKPFGERLDGAILTLLLDTPGCDVNVFGQDAAAHLLELLEPSRLSGVEAVVIRSKKPGSFVNGAGLLMANTAQRPDDAGRFTATIRRAYRAIREFPVPVIAAIQGNCYGCGVEFALQAAYRVAERSQDTHFYMTEIADYLFLPTFGSTQDLPRLVGLENAVDFLLWGERWTADQAVAKHLIDAAFDTNEFEARLGWFVSEVISGVRPSRLDMDKSDIGSAHAKATARIRTLPPMYRALYAEALDLLVRAASTSTASASDYESEVAACGRSLMNPMAKAALSTFFVRQLAKAVSQRGARRGVDRVDVIGVPALYEDLVDCKVRDLTVSNERAGTSADGALRLAAYGATAEPDDVTVRLAPLNEPIHWSSNVCAYAPLHRAGKRLVEIAGRDSGDVATAASVLSRAGFTAVPTRPEQRFVLDEMALAFFEPIRRFLDRGGDAACVARTMRDFGFVTQPAELARSLELDVALPDADPEAGTADGALLDAVLVSLLGFAQRVRSAGIVPHASVTDVMARELLDFPLAYGTLGKYMSGSQARELVAKSPTFAHYVGEAALDQAKNYVTSGKYFYV